MTRQHFVKSARKDYPNAGIKKGDSYYWWKFRFGSKNYSKTPPKPSQLTQSEFMRSVYDIEDSINSISDDMSKEDIQSEIESIAEDIRSLGEEQDDKISNMPDSLQESDTAELLRERHEACGEWADELRQINFDQEKEGIIADINSCGYQGE